MEKQVRYCTPFSSDIVAYLKTNGIPFFNTGEGKKRWIIYTISDKDTLFMQHCSFLQSLDHVSVIQSVKYSEKEITSAAWLTCEAVTAKVHLEREEETFAVTETYDRGKAYHRSLTGRPFYTSKPVGHSPLQNFFYSYQLTPSHLFCTEYAKKALQFMNPSIKFEEVLHSKTERPIADLFYVDIQQELPSDAVNVDCAREEYRCPRCGKITYCPPLLPLQIYREYLPDNAAVCKTAEIFSLGGNLSFSVNLVSQRFYQAIKANNLGRGLRFAPVALV